MTAWAALSATGKREAARQAVRVDGLTYKAAAIRLGTTRNAINGAIKRGESGTPVRQHRAPLNPQHPLLRQLFEHADDLGISATHWAEEAGYSPALVSQIRAGKTGTRLTTFVDLATVVGFDVVLVPRAPIAKE